MRTIVINKLSIKIFIMNNNGHGIIKQFQELYLSKRYEASDLNKGVSNPDFEKLCRGYKINYSSIKRNNDIEKIIKKVLSSNKPEFIDVFVNPNQKIITKLAFGDPIEDLSPKISRKDFNENMIIKTIFRNKKITKSN